MVYITLEEDKGEKFDEGFLRIAASGLRNYRLQVSACSCERNEYPKFSDEMLFLIKEYETPTIVNIRKLVEINLGRKFIEES